MLRVPLFLITNIAILAVLWVSAQVLGIDQWLNQQGVPFAGLFVFAALFGFGGSFLSLAISKWLAIRTTGAQVITEPSNRTESWLLNTVHKLADQANIGRPDVAIYRAQDINAFATGMNRNNALVAVSEGLLQQMNQEEAEAVLAHEVAHIANGDMVTMALLQGVLNTFVIALARIVGMMVDSALSRDGRSSGIGFYATYFVAEMVFGLLASIVVMWFSRRREFRADAGSADLVGPGKMIAALQRLQQAYEPSSLPSQFAAFGINGAIKGGMAALFRSHPPLQSRIDYLRNSL